MKRIVWISKMCLGFACYWPVMIFTMSDNKFYMWMLSWAGFWAFDTGYKL